MLTTSLSPILPESPHAEGNLNNETGFLKSITIKNKDKKYDVQLEYMTVVSL